MRKKLEKEILNAMSRDPGYWRGPFYCNKKDPRLWVPKLYSSMGWTLNFASPYAYVLLVLIVVAVVVLIVFK